MIKVTVISFKELCFCLVEQIILFLYCISDISFLNLYFKTMHDLFFMYIKIHFINYINILNIFLPTV